MTPDDPVSCETLRVTTMPAKACALRHVVRRRTGPRGRDVPVHRICAECELGARRAAALVQAGWAPPERFGAVGPVALAEQHAARARWMREHMYLAEDAA